MRRGDRQPRRTDLQPQGLPRDRGRAGARPSWPAQGELAMTTTAPSRTSARRWPPTTSSFASSSPTSSGSASTRTRVRRPRGPPGDRGLLGAGRVPVAAVGAARRSRDRRRGHRGLRVPGTGPDRVRAGAHGAQPRRREPRHAPRGASRAGDEVDRDARVRGAEAALASGDGPAREDSARSLSPSPTTAPTRSRSRRAPGATATST